jgi:glycosyltransferase involved in cell wall biosynthesis
VLAPDCIVVVPNGLDLEETRGEQRDGTHVRVLFLSSLFPSKGTHVFIRSFAIARQGRPNLRATIAGTWPDDEMRKKAVGLAAALGVAEAIDFPGQVAGAAKTKLLYESDIFCFPSFYPLEGQPLVVIEAMAAGLPVVATAWRGIADTVVDGQTGFLVPEPSPRLIAEQLIRLCDDGELRLALGRAGRARYLREYTSAAFGQRIVRLVEPFLRPDARAASAPAPAGQPS